jgi:hypothetical protein
MSKICRETGPGPTNLPSGLSRNKFYRTERSKKKKENINKCKIVA